MLIRLVHHAGLGYPPVTKRTALPLPQQIVELARANAMVVTFRPPLEGRPDRRIKNLTAVDRFLWAKADRLVFFGLETDSPLAPVILWDVAHAAKVGTTLSLLGDQQSKSFLERPYFSKAFRLLENETGRKVFLKESRLAAEEDTGLDAWTFGIPVGPEDATLLNATVERILDLDVPVKEILLCGRPGPNFRYLDRVRIVGEDITAPPVKICAKKNRLAQEASHPNLCIIHDRVFLPSHFYDAVKRFGDFYPLTTLQSLFFDDKYNLIPRRYSDFGVSYRAKASVGKGLMRDNDASAPNIFSPTVFPLLEMSGFYCANALRYDTRTYPTGSMYLCKRSVWAAYPQNESLHWIEFEDVEHAYRAMEGGVPSRINPNAVTQSLISRPLLGRVAGTYLEPMKGPPRLTRTWSEFIPLPRKPAIKASQESALAGLRRFAEKYVPGTDPLFIPSAAVLRSPRRIETIIQLLSRVQLPLHEASVRQFISDFEKWIVLDQLPFSFVEHACHRMLADRADPVRVLVEENEILRNHLALRPKENIFYSSLAEYLQNRSWLLVAGTFISSLYLFVMKRRIVYLLGGPWAYFRALMKSTPFGLKS